jgi:hypothetical protein
LSYLGSWDDAESGSIGDSGVEMEDWEPQYLPEAPQAPDPGRLATPPLSPIPSMFEFCYCRDSSSDDAEAVRINQSIRFSRRDKVDAQCKYTFACLATWTRADETVQWALDYMEQRKR